MRKASRVETRGARADQRVDHPLLGVELRLGGHLFPLDVAHQADAGLEQVAHDLVDVAADIADLGEFGGLDLDEGRAGELGEAARDLRLADAGRADHQDVLGQHLLAHLLVELLAPPAIAQGDGDGALGVALADDVAVELGDDLAGEKLVIDSYSLGRVQGFDHHLVIGVDHPTANAHFHRLL